MTGKMFQINCPRRSNSNSNSGNNDVFLWFDDAGKLTNIRCPSYNLDTIKGADGKDKVEERCVARNGSIFRECLYTETLWTEVPYEV